MSRIFTQSMFVSASALAFFLGLALVEGRAVENHVEVQCLPSAPTICIGEYIALIPESGFECPDLPDTSTCGETDPVGGWDWEYIFVDGLSDGVGSWPAIEAAKTGLIVKVRIEDDRSTGSVTTEAGETCTSCSACDSDGGSFSIQYDCTNLANGSSVNTCVSMDPFVYPFDLGAAAVSTPAPSSNAATSNIVLWSMLLPRLVGLIGF